MSSSNVTFNDGRTIELFLPPSVTLAIADAQNKGNLQPHIAIVQTQKKETYYVNGTEKATIEFEL